MLKIAICGLGARGGETYGLYFNKRDDVEIVAIADTNKEKLEYYKNLFSIKNELAFNSADELLKKDKLADVLVLATLDQTHYKYAMKAMKLGYNLLLEKPISNNIKECLEIRDYAVSHNLKVIVCHVMRYTSYYKYLKKELDNGRIGRIISIEQTEDVTYWHMAHAFVRGNFNNSLTTSPMILQKCCHDMDLLLYLTNSKPLRISSMGELSYFKKENAPENSSDRCIDCKIDKCPWNAKDFYLNNVKELIKNGNNPNVWPYAQLTVNVNEETITNSLKTSNFGKCVFKSNNNVVDHEFTLIQFENGIIGTLAMVGFASTGGRQTHVYGTKGDVYLNEKDRTITFESFLGEKEIVNFESLSNDFSGHGGGDKVMLDEFVDVLTGKKETGVVSDISMSVGSHLMCEASEISRLNKGALIDLLELEKKING